MIRPQAKKARQAQETLKSLKKGDQVLTSGGILGTIVGVSETFVDLKASDSTRFKVLKASVTPYTEKNLGQNLKQNLKQKDQDTKHAKHAKHAKHTNTRT